MTSTRKVRNANKKFAKTNEESPEKAGGNASKGKGRKRKLSDMLGCQWSPDELMQFYETYRKYGKDWKKVAAVIRNRSVDMVDALYKMNKAYLSLPDGMATASGLIAMMIDHYNILVGSESERESNDELKTSNKSQKRGRGKLRANYSKGSAGRYPDLLQLPSSSTSYGFMLSKKRHIGGTQPRAVGKRTPRFPVSYISDKNKTISPKLQSFKFGRDADSDDEGVHVAALALTEACRGGSPQVSRTPGSKTDIHSGERKHAESEVANSKFSIHMDEGPEGSLGSREAENDDFNKNMSHTFDTESARTIALKPKVKKSKGKKPKVGSENHFDDSREACSGTEEGITARNIKNEIEMELEQRGVPSSNSARRKSQQLFSGDESTAIAALQTLANVSLNMAWPSSTVESESSAQIKEERNLIAEKPTTHEKLSKNDSRDKNKLFSHKEKMQPSVVGVDVVRRKNSKSKKTSPLDTNISSETKQETDQVISKIQKRKRKTPLPKVSEIDTHTVNCLEKSQKIEVSADEEKKYATKSKRVSQFSSPSKLVKSTKPPENSSSSTDPGKAAVDVAEVPHVPCQAYSPTKSKNRRKQTLYKAMASKELKSSEGAGENHLDKFTTNESTMDFKEMFSHCLSSPLFRRWCIFEWFYSAIDYPWFAKSEFVDYLNHVGLGHVPRLTRVEWGVIRSSLGKPRRLSKQFLYVERQKLEQYRESVRTHYTELRAGIRDGLPTDLARPLSVGQRVIACHPKTREIHDGSVLTVDRNRCRVQFAQPQFGVELIMDIDCMPLNPLENMPDALRKQNLVSDRFFEGLKERKPYDYLKEWKSGGLIASSENMDTTDGPAHCSTSDYPMNTLMKHAKEDSIDAIVQARAAANEVAVATQRAMYTQPCTLAQIQAKEHDIRAIAEMTRALDKKEALLIELKQMNEEVALKQKEDEPIRDIENFRKQYAMVLLQLRDSNDMVASALLYLRKRNTFVGNSTPRMGTVDNSNGTAGPSGALNESVVINRYSGSHVVGIVETSRRKAKTMVDLSVQALASLKEGEDAFSRVGEVLDSTRKLYSGGDSGMPGMKPFRSTEPGHFNLSHQEPASSAVLDPTMVNEDDPISSKRSNGNETQFPSEMISSCVSTLLMIQRCTERQYPPAEVAQILESAVTSLQPCCSQNLPIFQEIEVPWIFILHCND